MNRKSRLIKKAVQGIPKGLNWIFL